MKSINQIFKNNPDLMKDSEVKELIDYCRELEGDVMDSIQSKQFSFEDKLTELARDVFIGIKQILKEDEDHQRFGGDFEKPDYEVAVNNLKQYFLDFAKDNNFRL
jgi:hypothetical protein